MVKRNTYLTKLSPSYLFPEVMKRVRTYREKNPSAKILSLSIGDTSEPLPPFVCQQLLNYTELLGTPLGYQGYGPEQGYLKLRQQIAQVIYNNRIDPDEIFISDGAKCDLGRLHILFGSQITVAIPDPSYPAFVDTSLAMGQAQVFLPCLPENHFFPLLQTAPSFDLFYLCSPNNPTGTVATKQQLEGLVAEMKKRKAILIFDAAYSGFIQNSDLPRSIYEIPGAQDVAIEVSSFSKLVGFTGVRLGWTVIPKNLRYENGDSLWNDWNRLTSTFFNGASNIAQAGGEAALSPQGIEEMQQLISFYQENTRILQEAFRKTSWQVFGGENAPYLWIDCGGTNDSWEHFQTLLETKQIVVTPGSGFGSGGKGFIRVSAFGKRETILEAAERIAR